MEPLLVIVTGAPGSGKTVLSRKVATGLQLPVISKDLIKEGLLSAFSGLDRETSRRLGAASFEVLYRITTSLLDAGAGAVIEAPFSSNAAAQLTSLSARARILLLHCAPAPAVAAARYRARFLAGERHAGHFDGHIMNGLESRIAAGEYDPPSIGAPLMIVDTSDDYSPSLPAILDWIRRTS